MVVVTMLMSTRHGKKNHAPSSHRTPGTATAGPPRLGRTKQSIRKPSGVFPTRPVAPRVSHAMRFDKVLGVRHTYWELGHRFGSYFPFTTRTVEYRISNPSYHGVRYFQSLVPWSAVFPIPRTSNPSYRGVQRTFSNPGYKHLLTLFLFFSFFLFFTLRKRTKN